MLYLQKQFRKQARYLNHISRHKEGLSFVLYKDVYNGLVKIYRKTLENVYTFPELFEYREDVTNLIGTELLTYPKLKISISVQCEYILEKNFDIDKELFNLRTSNFVVTNISEKILN